MSTTTPGPQTPESGALTDVAEKRPRLSVQGWFLIILVFISGAVSLAIELSASRLLAPYFGTSLFVWSNVIGLILLYLTVGYYIGGRLADRYPSHRLLYTLTSAAALLVGLIPVISRPILNWSLSSFATYSIGVFYGSLVSVILLFAIPTILLGCVSPFAIRLSVDTVGHSGRTAGRLYAISTAGSMLGTFLPTLLLIPNLGTYRTFISCAAALLLVSLIGLVLNWPRQTSSKTSGIKDYKKTLTLLLFLPLGLSLLGIQGPIKPASGTDGGGRLIAERESAYNYIQVAQVQNERQLILNEGVGVHSIYNPDTVLTQGPWDYFLIAPFFNPPPFTQAQVKKVCIIGLGAGTSAREFSATYGNVPIDGVEIDPEIVDVGRRYFAMNEPNLNVIVQDGRNYLRSTDKKYDVIGMDAYQQPYVPFQLATHEFFSEVRSRLTPTGVAVINAGRTSRDYRLVEALAQTMRSSFSNVYIIDTARFANSMIVGTNAPTHMENFQVNSVGMQNNLLRQVMQTSLSSGNMREETQSHTHFTDDQAPVEQLINQIIFDEVTRPQK